MTEPNFNFDILDVPTPIKTKLLGLSKNIEITKRSRKGSNGWLFFGQNRIHKQKVAIKFYDWGGKAKYHAEPKNLATINSENVTQILDASFVDTDYAFFLTPYFENGDLDNEICNGIQGNLRAIAVSRDILSGLSHLHAQSLLHRDLKAQNILIGDDNKAVIGDFGSVKKIPQGNTSVPGSGHSLIYTPPESITSGLYGIPGDIYQVGIILFQMLGGRLPYEEYSWLNFRELKKYRAIPDDIDRQIFATKCIKKKIEKCKIVDLSTLPPWVCIPLRRTISKACNIDPGKRYQSCSEFLARLNFIRGQIHDWKIESGCPVRQGVNRHRVVYNTKKLYYFVQKDKGAGWRKDNSFQGKDLTELVSEIEKIR
ncbi:MAG: serine/threonine protein kinase [Proteobacteria bacterium]|nr:serine/threonine protein kinase [Pseudomonadota bacterium]